MKINELKQMLKSGIQPVVEINAAQVKVGNKIYENGAVEYGDMSPGMMARLISVKDKKNLDGIVEVTVDMSEFYDHNCNIDEGIHYGISGMSRDRTYKWHELPSYPKNHLYSFYVGNNGEIIEFKVLDEILRRDISKIYKETSNGESYIQWLEAIAKRYLLQED